MELVSQKILNKISRINPILFQANHQTDDYLLDLSTLWMSNSDFIHLQDSYPYFSDKLLISGILFSKSKKPNHWFKAKFYCLYKDRLVLYNKKKLQTPKKIMILKGVHLRLLEQMIDEKELHPLISQGIVEQKSIVLYRNKSFEILFAGPEEQHTLWLNNLRKLCILNHFKKNYNLKKLISPSNFASIYEAVSFEKNTPVVVKIFRKDSFNVKTCLSIQNEINVLRSLDDAHNVQIIEVYESKKRIHLIFDKFLGGDLYKKLENNDFNKFEENEIKIIMKQLLKAVKCLHQKEIMHRDIKPENIFFVNNYDLTLKLGDFGLAEYEKKKELLFTRCGTPGYLAPEVILLKPYDKKCDIFSLGVILYILSTGLPLFDGKNCFEIASKNKIAEEIMKNIDIKLLNLSNECVDLLEKMLTLSADGRISAEDALTHEWFGVSNPSPKKDHHIQSPFSEFLQLERINHKGQQSQEIDSYNKEVIKNEKIIKKTKSLHKQAKSLMFSYYNKNKVKSQDNLNINMELSYFLPKIKAISSLEWFVLEDSKENIQNF